MILQVHNTTHEAQKRPRVRNLENSTGSHQLECMHNTTLEAQKLPMDRVLQNLTESDKLECMHRTQEAALEHSCSQGAMPGTGRLSTPHGSVHANAP